MSSCSQEGKTPSKMSVTLSGLTAEQASLGGFYLEVENNFGLKLPFILDGSNPVVNVPNGNWKFHIVTFEGPTSWTGDTRCGSTSDFITLSGSPITVEMTITNANCAAAPFPAMIASRNPAGKWDQGLWDQAKWGP